MGVAASIAALTDVPDADAGVASGIEESTFQIGTPLGVAVLTTVALTRTDRLVADGVHPLDAQVQGFQLGFGGAATFAGLDLVIGVTLLRARARDRGFGSRGSEGPPAS